MILADYPRDMEVLCLECSLYCGELEDEPEGETYSDPTDPKVCDYCKKELL